MRYFSLACDFDGTLAHEGEVSVSTLAALGRLRASGRRLILVTGRELDDLLRVFPESSMFERIVAENGALLYCPSSRDAKTLGEPPPPAFIEALRKRHVEPLSIGRSIVATEEPQDTTVLEIIRQLGLELQVIYNKGSVMILPSGVNKATGLLAALSDLGLSEHNAVAVGDAENDHALLNVCECRVAVANAVPTLKERADITTTEPNGKGVQQLIRKLLDNDLGDVETRRARSHLLLGKSANGQEVAIKSYGTSLMIAGPSESGKSTVVRSLLERLLEGEYQVCLIDPEGDYDDLDSVITLGSSARAPDIQEVLQLLEKPKTSVGVNLVGLPLPERPVFFGAFLPKIQELRARTGRPHWIILDEAHHLLPSSWAPATDTFPDKMTGLILVTVQVGALLPAVLKSMTGIIAVGPSPEQTIRQFSKAIGVPGPAYSPHPPKTGEVSIWLVRETTSVVSVHVQPASRDVRRHKRKYAEGRLEPDRSFFFTGAEGKLNLRAYNLTMFIQMAEGVDVETWLHHLRQGEYSKWIREAIKDEDLASEVMKIEKNQESEGHETRKQIIEAINKRYTASE
jgi:hydroxymethylpyrimidine pyrophosphatase-like HAD family hydrolase